MKGDTGSLDNGSNDEPHRSQIAGSISSFGMCSDPMLNGPNRVLVVFIGGHLEVLTHGRKPQPLTMSRSIASEFQP